MVNASIIRKEKNVVADGGGGCSSKMMMSLPEAMTAAVASSRVYPVKYSAASANSAVVSTEGTAASAGAAPHHHCKQTRKKVLTGILESALKEVSALATDVEEDFYLREPPHVPARPADDYSPAPENVIEENNDDEQQRGFARHHQGKPNKSAVELLPQEGNNDDAPADRLDETRRNSACSSTSPLNISQPLSSLSVGGCSEQQQQQQSGGAVVVLQDKRWDNGIPKEAEQAVNKDKRPSWTSRIVVVHGVRGNSNGNAHPVEDGAASTTSIGSAGGGGGGVRRHVRKISLSDATEVSGLTDAMDSFCLLFGEDDDDDVDEGSENASADHPLRQQRPPPESLSSSCNLPEPQPPLRFVDRQRPNDANNNNDSSSPELQRSERPPAQPDRSPSPDPPPCNSQQQQDHQHHHRSSSCTLSMFSTPIRDIVYEMSEESDDESTVDFDIVDDTYSDIAEAGHWSVSTHGDNNNDNVVYNSNNNAAEEASFDFWRGGGCGDHNNGASNDDDDDDDGYDDYYDTSELEKSFAYIFTKISLEEKAALLLSEGTTTTTTDNSETTEQEEDSESDHSSGCSA